jgi:Pyridine nucleotide-disulphide oxidoreductase
MPVSRAGAGFRLQDENWAAALPVAGVAGGHRARKPGAGRHRGDWQSPAWRWWPTLPAHCSGRRSACWRFPNLHLEKGSAFAARGVLLPPYDTASTLERLARLIQRYAALIVVALGDNFHDIGGPARLAASDRKSLLDMQRGRDWIRIAGNHDPEPRDGIVRGAGLEASMSRYLVDRIKGLSNVEVLARTNITGLEGRDGILEAIRWWSAARQNVRQPIRHLFLFIGAEPNTDWLADSDVALDANGFVLTGQASGDGRLLESSRRGVFAIGDVRSGSVKRVAAAVGEGAQVVAALHGLLADTTPLAQGVTEGSA